MTATAAACQEIWLKNLLGKLTNEDTGPVYTAHQQQVSH